MANGWHSLCRSDGRTLEAHTTFRGVCLRVRASGVVWGEGCRCCRDGAVPLVDASRCLLSTHSLWLFYVGLCSKMCCLVFGAPGLGHQQVASERHTVAFIDEWEDFMAKLGKAMLLMGWHGRMLRPLMLAPVDHSAKPCISGTAAKCHFPSEHEMHQRRE